MTELDRFYNKIVKISQKNKLPRRKIVAILMLVLVILFLAALAVWGPFLKVTKIVVKPLGVEDFRYLEVAAVEEVGKEQFIGSNLFVLNLTEHSSPIESSSTFIKTVVFQKSFPKTIEILVEEREPLLVASTKGGCFLLDAGGFVLEVSDLVEKSEGRLGGDNEDKSAGSNEEELELPLCESLIKKYTVPLLTLEKAQPDFVLGKQSTFYDTEKLMQIFTVIRSEDYEVAEADFDGAVYIIEVGRNRDIVFSPSADLEIQLKRFILVAQEIEDNKLTFRKLDLRYKRPVLTK